MKEIDWSFKTEKHPHNFSDKAIVINHLGDQQRMVLRQVWRAA